MCKVELNEVEIHIFFFNYFRLKNGDVIVNGQQIKAIENHKLTEYFPVRRSVRKTTKTVLEEKQRNLELILKKGIEEGLEVIIRKPFILKKIANN